MPNHVGIGPDVVVKGRSGLFQGRDGRQTGMRIGPKAKRLKENDSWNIRFAAKT